MPGAGGNCRQLNSESAQDWRYSGFGTSAIANIRKLSMICGTLTLLESWPEQTERVSRNSGAGLTDPRANGGVCVKRQYSCWFTQC